MRKVEEMPKVTEPKLLPSLSIRWKSFFVVLMIGLVVLAGVSYIQYLSLSRIYRLIPSVKGERHTEFYVLGPGREAEDYPFDVGVGEEYSVYVGVVNHMGEPENCIVYVKFRNQTPPNSKPSPLPPLYEFRFSVADGETWESLLTFEILDTSVEGDSMLVGNISFNGVASSVDSLSMWDSEHDGFYYQLFFELWLYDIASQSFQYHNQSVGIWLNMTSASYI